ncbi:MAG: NADH-quinone oxidoreductase subunit D, partial [Actinomycetota bacterium]|nr:NADH-quinone oxidoreductase subunit D [Actinomycetota bacterium]
MESLAPLAIAGPLLIAAALAGSVALSRRESDLAGVVAGVAVAALCAVLLVDAWGSDGPLTTFLGGWEPRQGVALGIALAFDPFGAALALLAAVLVTAAFAFAWRYFDAAGPLFHALMLVFLGGMVGFCLSGDLFDLFVFFELMSVSAFALTAYRTESTGPLQGALTFAVTNSIGAMLLLFGIGLLYGRTGALNLAQVGQALAGQPADGLVVCAFGLIVVGFMVKAAIVPFHFWLADAYAVAPTPACIVFSGVMSDLGIYAIARVYWTVFDGTLDEHVAALRMVLVGAGALTAVWGAAMCIAQHRLKRLLAFVTISQVGMALMAVGLLTAPGLAATALLIGVDGLLRAGLFVIVGAIGHRCGSMHEHRLRGRGREMSWTVKVAFVVGVLGLAGLPPVGAFVGKGALERAAAELGYGWVTPIILVSTVLTCGALLRAGGRVFLGWGRPEAAEPEVEGEETIGGRDHTPWPMTASAVALVVAGVALGAIPGLAAAAAGVAGSFTDRHAYA